MSFLITIFQRLRLRHFLFLLLLLSGIVPLAVSSYLVIQQNREILETQEKSYLTQSAQFLSLELNQHLVSTRQRLDQLGQAVRLAPLIGAADDKLRQQWLQDHLQSMLATDPDLVALRVLNQTGTGPYTAAIRQSPELVEALDLAFSQARDEAGTVYRFLALPGSGEPVAVLAMPVAGTDSSLSLYVEGVTRLRRMESVFKEEAQGDVDVFLVDRSGQLLWWGEASEGQRLAVTQSRLVRDFVQTPLNMTQEYTLQLDGEKKRMLGRISPVEEAGWGIVVHRSADRVLAVVQEMVINTAVSTGILLALALAIAVLAARKVSNPIQQLADSTHEIAAGNFGQRIEVFGPGQEITELAKDFNRMTGQLESHIDKLRDAAQANRELFIGSMRAFVAAIDAKDPYTRGHSERVAAYSRVITKHLGLPESDQNRIWVGALLHDVGKIGIEDKVLTKGGVLTDEEYEQMKLHPVIGAEIMSRIEQLKDMIPAIRWHHEAWNGSGYPDGLEGERIPLSARIVGIADTFDAITTNRPYQKAYEPAFAVETIQKLAGKRFDVRVVEAFQRAFEAGLIQKRGQAPTTVPAEPPVRAAASS